MSDPRPPTETQLARDLPGPTTFITGHDESGAAVLVERRPVRWTQHDEGRLGMSVAYTTDFPADLNGAADLKAHDARMEAAAAAIQRAKETGEPLPPGGGLVRPGGTVLRFVELAPGYECMMHRTQSVDYGIVIEGEVTCMLGPGSDEAPREPEAVAVARPGDVIVQRATMHAWRNDSATRWARIVFCLQDCQALTVAGKRLREDLGRGTGQLPPSGNDG